MLLGVSVEWRADVEMETRCFGRVAASLRSLIVAGQRTKPKEKKGNGRPIVTAGEESMMGLRLGALISRRSSKDTKKVGQPIPWRWQ